MRAASSVPMANHQKHFQSKIIRNASHTEHKIDSLMMGETGNSPAPLMAFRNNSQSASASNGETETMVP